MSLYGGVEFCGRPDLENVRKLDLLPMKPVMEMQRYGMAIDIPHLEALTETLTHEINELRYLICSEIPADKLDEFIEKSNMDADDDYLPMNVGSIQQMRRLLFDVLGVGKGHQLKLTKSGDVSTGKRQMEARKSDHPIIQKVLDYRERAKLRGTYTVKLPRFAKFHNHGKCKVCGLNHKYPTFRAHTNIMMTRTTTGRFASARPFNLQNIPVRSKHGKEVRRGFIASPGTRIISVDFSQLQLRILADRAKERKMIWIFENDKDPHTMTASWTFGVAEDKVVKAQRDPSKNVNFGIVFGETAPSLYDQLISDSYGRSGTPVPDWLTLEWCKTFFSRWHGIYEDVQPYMDQQHYRAFRYGVVWDMFGRVRRIPEVRSVHNRVIAAGLRQAGNHPIQAPDSGMMRLVMAEVQEVVIEPLQREGIWCWLLMTIHDELLIEVDEEYAEFVKNQVICVFENVMVDRQTGKNLFRVPIRAEGHVSERWEK